MNSPSSILHAQTRLDLCMGQKKIVENGPTARRRVAAGCGQSVLFTILFSLISNHSNSQKRELTRRSAISSNAFNRLLVVCHFKLSAQVKISWLLGILNMKWTLLKPQYKRDTSFITSIAQLSPWFIPVAKIGNGERGTGDGERGTGNGEWGMGMGNLLKGEISKRRNLLKWGISKRGIH